MLAPTLPPSFLPNEPNWLPKMPPSWRPSVPAVVEATLRTPRSSARRSRSCSFSSSLAACFSAARRSFFGLLLRFFGRFLLRLLLFAALEEFKGGVRVGGGAVFEVEVGGLDGLVAPGVVQQAHIAFGRQHPDMLRHAGHALFVQHRDDGFAGAQLGKQLHCVEGGVLPEGFRRGFQHLALRRGVGTQAVLDLVAQLRGDRVRDVPRGLGDKVDAHALGADELDHLLDLFHQLAAGAVEQKVRFVKEKHDPGLVHIPTSGRTSNSSDSR